MVALAGCERTNKGGWPAERLPQSSRTPVLPDRLARNSTGNVAGSSGKTLPQRPVL
jgi:hypothetical protein